MGKYKISQTLAPAPGMSWFEKEVDGEPVHFAGFEGFQFFFHFEITEDKWGRYETFIVSEVQSGCKIGSGLSLEEAIAKASSNLAKDTPEILKGRIDTFLKLKEEASK